MFTGLIEQMGVLVSAGPSPAGPSRDANATRLLIDPQGWAHHPKLGDSIACNGCCLTLAADPAATDSLLAFDAIPETLAKTTLGSWKPGKRIHLEHSATLGTLLGGHLVQGHVDGIGIVIDLKTQGEWRTRIRPAPGLIEFFAPKGSVCVDGVSLTVAALDPKENWFEVTLIPVTLEKTTLADLTPGATCNLEADVIGKQVVHWLRHFAGTPRPDTVH